ncbi:MAG: hypothetical protein WC840_00240 [Candidatus Peribacteraceae bacterium]
MLSALRDTWRRHRLLIVVMVILSVVAALTQVNLRGSLLGGTGTGGTSSSEGSLRTCSDAWTVFEGKENATEIMNLFRSEVTKAVEERVQYFEKPSNWKCMDKEPSMPKLRALAAKLPGWHYPQGGPGAGGSPLAFPLRPVLFESSASVLGEFLREYECKIVALDARATYAVLTGNDIDAPCLPGACPPVNSADLAVRVGAYRERLKQERSRARLALERTLHLLRSFDANYQAARDIVCLQRASLDLRSELNLLADTTSCMPKIWDALTSIHDRK